MIDARADRWGAALLLAVTLGLLAAWPVWRLTDLAPADAYAQTPENFAQSMEVYVAVHQVGERDGMPLIRPQPGADIPVIARRFEFWPALELKAGQSYRLHVTSLDTVHTVVVHGQEFSLIPGQVRVIQLAPAKPGMLILQCGEYCGLGHNRMRGSAEVVD
ncbi:MAG: quinol oxidase [Magnetospirillum sp.]|nr:quinol oxidase [Magnetospirillum sp.]